jgi:WD40 repeat protein
LDAVVDDEDEFEFTSSNSDDEDIDVKVLKLEACISCNSLPHTPVVNNDLSIVNHYNLHFDWINDIKLVNGNQNLVSCSSDLSIKIVNLATDQITRFPNHHTDYIRKLSYNPTHSPHQIASGGLDGKINIWDLSTLKSFHSINNTTNLSSTTSSIYSLANNANIIATGGPSHTINLFDKRSHANPYITKLIGHLDNIKCLLMNDRFILSGSSDCSIKLWDLRTYKLYKKFDIHDYPVWSLTSPGDDFSTFYSGDKSGRIMKTDVSQLSTFSQEKIPEFESFTASDVSILDEKVGVSTIIADEESPVLSLCCQGQLIFSSNSNCFNQYIIPNTSQIAAYQYLRVGIDHLINKDLLEIDESVIPATSPSNQDDLNSDFYDLISHLSMDTHNVDVQSTFLSIHNANETPPTEANERFDSDEDFSSMFIDPNGGPSKEFINVYKDDAGHNFYRNEGTIDETPVEILLNPILSQNVCYIPYNYKPLAKFKIEPKSIVSKRMFNDKRQIIVLYLNGDVKIWDMLTCCVVRTWANEIQGICLDTKQLETRAKEMDNIFLKLQVNETLNNWCDVEIKAGKLFVTLKESSFLNVEIYLDELVKKYPMLSLDHDDNVHLKAKNVKANCEDRHYLGGIVLSSFFHEYALYEWQYDLKVREELRNLNKVDDDTSVSTNLKKFKYFSKTSYPSTTSSTRIFTGKDTESTKSTEEHDVTLVSKSLSMTSLTSSSGLVEDSISRLLLANRKHYTEKYQSNGHRSGLVESLLRVDYIDLSVREGNLSDTVPYFPLINSKTVLPQDLQIMIFEYSPDLGNYRDVSSFLLKDVNDNTMVNELRTQLPRWVGWPILYNRYSPREAPKIAFQLSECNYLELSPTRKIGGKTQKKIKRLPTLESSIKLTSHNMLRVSRILTYLTEKFDSKTPEMKNGKPATEWLVLECKGIELTNEMTLQTIKTNIWKSSSDIELLYRRRFDPM